MAAEVAPSPPAERDPQSTEPFDVFISYSHAADGRLAPALQAGLQKLGKPWYRRRALRVFRDKTSLSATPQLWATIESALDGSRYFILLASPQAARSPWVQRELDWWRRHRNSHTLLVGLTDGHIRWDPAAGDFDWPATTALPATLAGFFDEEPLWVDLRHARDEQHLSLRDPRLRENVAELAAPVRGVGKDELIGEDVVQHRRTMRTARAAVAVLVVLAVVATVAGILAVRQAAETARQRDLAEAQAGVATSRALAAEATALRSNRLDLALLLAVQANRVDPTVQAREALLGTLTGRTEVVDYLRHHEAAVSGLAFSPDGRVLASTDRSGGVVLWNVPEGTVRREIAVAGEEALGDMAFSPTGELIAVAGNAVTLVDAADGTVAGTVDLDDVTVDDLGFAPDGSRVAAVGCRSVDNYCSTGRLKVWDVSTRRLVTDLVLDELHSSSAVTFHPSGRWVAVGGAAGDVALVDLSGGGPPVRHPEVHPDEVEALAFTKDGARLISASGSSTPVPDGPSGPATPTVLTWDLATGAVVRSQELPIISQGAQPVTIALGPGGETVLTVGDHHQPWLHDRSGNPLRDDPLIGHASTVWSAAFSPDGGMLATGEENGTILLWRTADSSSSAGRLVERRAVPGTWALSAAVSSDAGTLAVGDWDGVTLLDGAPLRQRARLDTGVYLGARALAFGPDDRLLAVGGTHGEDTGVGSLAAGTERVTVDLLDTVTGRRIWEPLSMTGSLNDLVFRPGTNTLVLSVTAEATSSGSVARVVFIDTATGSEIDELPGDHDRVTAVAFTDDGSVLATGHPRGVVRLWRADDRKLRSTLHLPDPVDVTALAFDPAGDRLAVGTGQQSSTESGDGTYTRVEGADTVYVWDVGTEPRLVQRLGGHADRGTTDLVFNGDGSQLAVGTSRLGGTPDAPLSLWEVDTGEQLIAPRLAPGEVSDLAVAREATGFLIAAADDEGVVLRQLDVESWIDAACDIAGRDLTDEEWAAYVGTGPRRSTC